MLSSSSSSCRQGSLGTVQPSASPRASRFGGGRAGTPTPSPWHPHHVSKPHTPPPCCAASQTCLLCLVDVCVCSCPAAGLCGDTFARPSLSEWAKPGPGPSRLCWENPRTVQFSFMLVVLKVRFLDQLSVSEMPVPGWLGGSVGWASDSQYQLMSW